MVAYSPYLQQKPYTCPRQCSVNWIKVDCNVACFFELVDTTEDSIKDIANEYPLPIDLYLPFPTLAFLSPFFADLNQVF